MTTKQGTWTDEQWQAITTRGKDILVAAAAGAGKTAVLVERIIQIITDETTDINVDQLLVVTFTNAAAAEMRHRISARLESALKETPESIKLQKQLALINKSSISTLHSFCLDVVRNFYYLIEMDPKFRIVDEIEAILLQEEALGELLEERYSDETDMVFFDLVDCYATDRDDIQLQKLILELYKFSQSHPTPILWLDELAARYDIAEVDIDEMDWLKDYLQDINLQLQGLLKLANDSLEITKKPKGPVPYQEAINSDIEQLEALCQAADTSWDELHRNMQQIDFKNLKRISKKDDCCAKLQSQAKGLRDEVKKGLKTLKDQVFNKTADEYIAEIVQMYPKIAKLTEITKLFAVKYRQLKSEKGLVDFADLEHYCLQILTQPEAADYYQKQFVEILVDEYQDTNLVQETIIQAIKTNTNNLFMVGDVKQSIYRFRLAEPELFLKKYKAYKHAEGVMCIDLSKNFRSRSEVLDGTNFIFKQLMDETIGEINYDRNAELVPGAVYEPNQLGSEIEVMLIDNNKDTKDNNEEQAEDNEERNADNEERNKDNDEYAADDNEQDLVVAQLEARAIAKQINILLAKDNGQTYQVFDKKAVNNKRNIRYRDIVILLRATAGWAEIMLEELKRHGIPAYADLTTGYFTATEVNVMMSLLKIIDNPYQDIPLAAVLRSPIVGLNGEQLAQIRLIKKNASFYDAFKRYIKATGKKEDTEDTEDIEDIEDIANADEIASTEKIEDIEEAEILELKQRLLVFNNMLQKWRISARQGALSDLIWDIYRETGYYDFVGGMESGNQRQANLRALYDRARGYEQTSFRGLFRFLRFIEHMQDKDRDLGTARALGEQEDVVRLMTIHKSKGLEFPVVFVAGLGKNFNMQDIRSKYTIHKKLGFGTAYINAEKRITYPLLYQQAIRQRVKMEQLSEEMRVLYVALTRAREKIYLIATSKNLAKDINSWTQQLTEKDWLLPKYFRANSKRFIDWIGASIIRHQMAQPFFEQSIDNSGLIGPIFLTDSSKWKVNYYKSSDFILPKSEVELPEVTVLTSIKDKQPITLEAYTSDYIKQVTSHLTWNYPHQATTKLLAKQSVSAIKQNKNKADKYIKKIIERPNFMQQDKLTAAERGTVMHIVMEHIDLSITYTAESITDQINRLVERELLTEEQRAVIEVNDFINFFQSGIGQRLLQSSEVHREVAFSVAIKASKVYDELKYKNNDELNNDDELNNLKKIDELVLVQGVIDCVFEEADGLVLLDYKSDKTANMSDVQLLERYQLQLDLYSQALESIWRKPVIEKYLFFFDGLRLIKV